MKPNVAITVRDYDSEKLIGDFETAAVPRTGEVFTCDAGSFQVRIVEHYAWKELTELAFGSPLVCLWVSPYRHPA